MARGPEITEIGLCSSEQRGQSVARPAAAAVRPQVPRGRKAIWRKNRGSRAGWPTRRHTPWTHAYDIFKRIILGKIKAPNSKGTTCKHKKNDIFIKSLVFWIPVAEAFTAFLFPGGGLLVGDHGDDLVSDRRHLLTGDSGCGRWARTDPIRSEGAASARRHSEFDNFNGVAGEQVYGEVLSGAGLGDHSEGLLLAGQPARPAPAARRPETFLKVKYRRRLHSVAPSPDQHGDRIRG